ncbi:hypothetical protein FPG92_05590 [Flavobacterium psychrophilum]|nr:hypothetical protein FPG92_05590 [Flavobacterium psychrophilum]
MTVMKMILFFLIPIFTYSQVNFPSIPQPTQFQNYGNPNSLYPATNNPKRPTLNYYMGQEQQRIQQQNQQIINQTQQREKQRQHQLQEIYHTQETDDGYKRFNANRNVNYHLPSSETKSGTQFYKEAFDKMQTLNVENYSVKEVNFLTENAYFDNKHSKAEFDKVVKQTGEFLIEKMKELHYDLNSNTAKNYMLFDFFGDNLQLKSTKQKHSAYKYDFVDYRGDKDWTKMFVSKLIKTGSGQCHSMPLLYLILAEEIGAESYLSTCPNHTYIKFQDENEKWYNVELTNNMFTTTSFILSSRYIKSEALQNNLYMQNMSKKELLSHFYCDLAGGYLAKFGNDEFLEIVIKKALELNPSNIQASMMLSNYYTVRFVYAMKKLKINPTDKQDLAYIKPYPDAVQYLKDVNLQYKYMDDSGYAQMPAKAYEHWLGTLKQAKNKQESQAFENQFKGIIDKKQPAKQ